MKQNFFKKHFYFGEIVKEYDVRVLNEREVRAAAGILFVMAFFSFMNAFLNKNMFYIKIFVIIFMIDFIIRVIINPKYSPTLILGKLITSNQEVEYSGAPQKRFAWLLGLIMAVSMFFMLYILKIISPVTLIVCAVCLILLFFETAFGICIGCKLYNLFSKDKAKLCPAGVCKIKRKEEIQKTNIIQITILILFILLIAYFIIFNPLQNINIGSCMSTCPMNG